MMAPDYQFFRSAPSFAERETPIVVSASIAAQAEPIANTQQMPDPRTVILVVMLMAFVILTCIHFLLLEKKP